ncbi:MAG: response regulator [Candidatus Omnitrophica bacterium]|nr:response regulator [Candidatus Omnitrophota bacterium]MDD5552947.1 response regulator [Candidatus Omnitrophota bacterium]
MSKKILIIDDDKEFCEELAECIREEGFYVECATDPLQGQKLILSGDYDAIILDYKMPELSGADLLKKMRTLKVKGNVFILSGRPFVEKVFEEEGLLDLIGGFFAKPVDMGSLLEKIRNAASRKHDK